MVILGIELVYEPVTYARNQTLCFTHLRTPRTGAQPFMVVRRSVLPFSKINKIFVGYFDPGNIFLIIKIINFQGDLTDNSAKKEALAEVYRALRAGILMSYCL